MSCVAIDIAKEKARRNPQLEIKHRSGGARPALDA